MKYQSNYLDKAETGNLKISENVIAAITNIVTKEVSGVAELTSVPVNIKGIFKKKKSVRKAISVDLGEGVAIINIYLRIKHGAKVQDVAAEIQKKVKEAVQNMTSVAVSKVNVHVTGIALEEKKQK